MADPEAVEALRDTLSGPVRSGSWQSYREAHPEPDLSQADLSNMDLVEVDFRGCNLSAAKLFNSDCAAADFSGANLTYGDLRRANLANAFLTDVRAAGVNMTGANLVDTNLDNADMRGARMGGAHLVGASLAGTDIRAADLRGANLKFTDLRRTHLEGANLEDATLLNTEIDPKVLKSLPNADRAVLSGDNAPEGGTSGMGNNSATAKPFEDYEELFLENDCYRILGIKKDADLDEITKAYRERAKEYHPDRVHNLGKKIQYVAQREFERVQHAYKSLSQAKAAPEASIDLGAASGAGQKDPSKLSLQDYVQLAKSNPNNEMIFYNLGVLYFRSGLYEKALQAYQRCLKLNPQNRNAQYNIRVAMMMKGLVQK